MISIMKQKEQNTRSLPPMATQEIQRGILEGESEFCEIAEDQMTPYRKYTLFHSEDKYIAPL